MTEIKKEAKSTKKICLKDCIFLAILVLLPFMHVCVGVEFTDTAYSLGNYENLSDMNLTWTVATFWANYVGKLFTMLPFGDLWIGMKIYTTLVVSLTAGVSFVFLKSKIPSVIAFVSEIFAICLCWCPTTILYNYLTYLLFTLAVVVLVSALEKESKAGMIVAGVILAFNVFVRFPNITEVALITVVWTDAVINKRKFKKGLLNTLVCVGGFLLGIAVNVGIIGVMYGFESIPQMVVSLFSMTKEETSYSPVQMVIKMIRSYYQYYLKSYTIIAGISVGCFFGAALLKKQWAKITVIVAQFLLYGVFLVWAVRNSVFTFKYGEYSSIYFWGVVFLILVNSFSIWSLLRKRTDHVHKLLAMACLVIIWITPLGSNNGLYPSFNNLYIVAPFTVYMIWAELFKGRNFSEILDLEAKNSMVSTRITVLLLVLCIGVQGLLFGVVFVFRDTGFPFQNTERIEGNERLKGMHTNSERKALIEELSDFVANNNLEGKKAVFYGGIPGLEYILKMPCAISHTWPDLGSFTFEEFKDDIDKLDYTPVIFVNNENISDIFNPDANFSDKDCYLSNFMESNEYKLAVRIQNIEVYITN